MLHRQNMFVIECIPWLECVGCETNGRPRMSRRGGAAVPKASDGSVRRKLETQDRTDWLWGGLPDGGPVSGNGWDPCPRLPLLLVESGRLIDLLGVRTASTSAYSSPATWEVQVQNRIYIFWPECVECETNSDPGLSRTGGWSEWPPPRRKTDRSVGIWSRGAGQTGAGVVSLIADLFVAMGRFRGCDTCRPLRRVGVGYACLRVYRNHFGVVVSCFIGSIST